MTTYPSSRWVRAVATILALCAGAAGCAHRRAPAICPADVPRECYKASLAEYVVEPPDILLIDALQVVPLPPYRVKPMDSLLVRVPKALPDEPIAGIFPVGPDGTISLGASYGSPAVGGMTLPEARTAIEKHLTALGLRDPRAEIALAEGRGVQQIRGQHLVRPDGTVGLGTYGSVLVAGLTLTGVKAAIENHLSQFLQAPEVSVDVAAYNSKVFYVVYDGGGAGQQVYRLPVTGNDTVLDAVSQLNGLSAVSDTNKIWVARAACDSPTDLILPVDWCAITARGRSETNYQLLPNDRIYVKADRLVTIDTRLGRLFSPLERIFGVTLLGSTTVRSVGGLNTTGQ